MEILTVAVMDPFNVYAPPSQESLESRPGADATEVQIPQIRIVPATDF